MKLLRLFPLLALLMIAGCQDQERERTQVEDITVTDTDRPDPEESFQEWEDAWNSNDPQRVQRLIADDAVLLLGGTRMESDSIQPWVERNAPQIRDLQAEPQTRNSSENIAYDAGTYTHRAGDGETEISGVYTFVWERNRNGMNQTQTNQVTQDTLQNANNEWRITVMHITETSEMEEENM